MPEPDLPRLGVCHAPGGAANLREIYTAAQGLCTVVMLMRPQVAEAHPELLRLAERFFECHVLPGDEFGHKSGGGFAGFLDALGLSGVTTFHDDELEAADALLEAVRRRPRPDGNPWDKLVQRRLLHEAGLSRVVAEPVDGPQDLLHAFSALGKGPCVLKPRRAAGGQGIAFLDDEADVERQLAVRTDWSGLLLETRIEHAPHPSRISWLGSLLSVETVSCGDRRTHLGVLDKLPVAVRRHGGPDGADLVSVQGDILPSSLPPELLEEATQLTGRALDRLAVRDRVTHTELLITPDGLEVMEVNGRLAGYTARLFRLAQGPDLVRIALAAVLGRADEIRYAPPAAAAAGLFPAFPHREGVVHSSLRARDLRDLPGVSAVDELARPGDPKDLTGHRMANLTVRAEHRAALDSAVATVLDALAKGFAEPADACGGHADRAREAS
ncbi:acetyl-CoA carboxylase biotin carboxylase subunit family protein [Streptomyces echinoruber]|uniref:ATP-grasp domain-containing protein n=1 Tax=Streptomyces echinoruber TaxID=68898 RepID=A0A918QT48_9ACTN|nr:ATP-grasp domain-containing protein [Streptomyces echinoruber]GGZ70802.1 hypothetical protein GCM10010389_05380 [Streptomyces echinoruber]